MQPNKILVDADIFLYVSSSSAERIVQFTDDLWLNYSKIEDAVCLLDNRIAQLEEDTGIADSDMLFCLSDDTKSFRYDIYRDYKANRKGTRKPMCYGPLKDYLIDNYETIAYPRLEGDDVIGILSYEEGVGIWSQDKDLKQIAGWHWEDDEWIEVTKEEGDRLFLWQTLVGDMTDGYRGCPGVGKVGADKALDADCSWNSVMAQYTKKKLTEADAVQQAQLARILRPGEYDHVSGYPKLWFPNDGL